MKLLLLTSATLALSTAATFSTASAEMTEQQVSAVKTQLKQSALMMTQTSGLHAGDFQGLAKCQAQTSLYAGSGAALMATIRMLRY